MTQYDEKVKEQALKLQAEQWGKQIKDMHSFDTKLTSVWYEERPNDGRVMDVRYNNGIIERHLHGTNTIVYLGKKIGKLNLMEAFQRWRTDYRGK
jgi:hypothetical protein